MSLLKKIKRKSELIAIDLIEKTFISLKTGRKEKTILLLKLDAIGDYILFRNFIEVLHQSKPDHKIILCGNVLWKDLAEKLDGAYISEFIWVKPRELDGFKYRYSVYKKIRKTKAGTLIHPTYSRSDNADKIAITSGAKSIIGYDGDCANTGPETKQKHNQHYTQLIASSQTELFEFYRYRHFFTEMLQRKIEIKRPYIKASKEDTAPSILIFPGAGVAAKRWPVAHFKALCNLLYNHYHLPIVLGGAPDDALLANEITKDAAFPFTNMVGKKSLYELIAFTAGSKLVIANDSGPFHISAATHTNSVCIFKGNHFGRFCPYPEEISEGLAFIYPDQVKESLADPVKRKILYLEGLETDLSTIEPLKVFEIIKNKFSLS